MSKIAWTDETWNPVTGCTKVSPGCKHCYMYAMYPRLKAMGTPGYPASPDVVTLRPSMLNKPLRWKRRRMVFVNSMSDLFHEDIPDDYLDQVFAVMALTPRHTYQILTKRPQRMLNYLNAMLAGQRDITGSAAHVTGKALGECLEPIDRAFRTVGQSFEKAGALRNVWLGVSVEDQIRADERIPILLDTPAAVRFLSCEPLLGPIDLNRIGLGEGGPWRSAFGIHHGVGIDWVIAGGESGPGARPCSERWLADIRDQTHAAGRPYFLKQLGGYPNKRVGALAVLNGRTWTQFPGDSPSWHQQATAYQRTQLS